MFNKYNYGSTFSTINDFPILIEILGLIENGQSIVEYLPQISSVFKENPIPDPEELIDTDFFTCLFQLLFDSKDFTIDHYIMVILRVLTINNIDFGSPLLNINYLQSILNNFSFNDYRTHKDAYKILFNMFQESNIQEKLLFLLNDLDLDQILLENIEKIGVKNKIIPTLMILYMYIKSTSDIFADNLNIFQPYANIIPQFILAHKPEVINISLKISDYLLDDKINQQIFQEQEIFQRLISMFQTCSNETIPSLFGCIIKLLTQSNIKYIQKDFFIRLNKILDCIEPQHFKPIYIFIDTILESSLELLSNTGIILTIIRLAEEGPIVQKKFCGHILRHLIQNIIHVNAQFDWINHAFEVLLNLVEGFSDDKKIETLRLISDSFETNTSLFLSIAEQCDFKETLILIIDESTDEEVKQEAEMLYQNYFL